MKKLLQLFKRWLGLKPKPVLVKSAWSELLTPFRYQDELMKKFHDENEKNFQEMLAKITSDQKIVVTGIAKMPGPYVSYETYYLSDGSAYPFRFRASLHWVDTLTPQEVYANIQTKGDV